jgi:hypothetical protein
MRILALSDIHGNVAAVARMRARQANDYDLLIVAGDIGGAMSREVFEVLDTFGCPVVYVYGNHDWDVAYDIRFGANGVHLYGTLVIIDRLCIVGFSGCPTNWGRNPIAVTQREAQRWIAVKAPAWLSERCSASGRSRNEHPLFPKSVFQPPHSLYPLARSGLPSGGQRWG